MSNPLEIKRLFDKLVELSDKEIAEETVHLPPTERQQLLELLKSDNILRNQSFLEIENEYLSTQQTSSDPSNHSLQDFSITDGFTQAFSPSGTDPTNRLPQFGQYQTLNEIAVHGQGAVYRANHPHLNRQVVIKVSKNPLDKNGQDLLVKEGQLLANLDHPNLAKVFDLQIIDDCPYLVIEYIEGSNLSELIKTQQFTPTESIELIQTISNAMKHVHENGIIHRDVKPANIVIRAIDKQPKVIDFGLAHQKFTFGDESLETSAGGTLKYMAPEQAVALKEPGKISNLDQRADIFALGAILYELFTGVPIYRATSNHEAYHQAVNAEIDFEPLDQLPIASHLKSACRKALSRAPSDRYSTVGEFTEALRTKKSSMARPVIITATIFAALLVAAAIYFFYFRPATPNDPDTQTAFKQEQNQKPTTSKTDPTAPTLSPGQLAPSPSYQAIIGFDFEHRSLSTGEIIRKPLFRNGAVVQEDQMRMNLDFKKATYCYFFSVNPDNTIQLCYPEDQPDLVQTEPVQQIIYPENPEYGFEFTDGFGQMAFFVVTSDQPLPSFSHWISQNESNLVRSVNESVGNWILISGQATRINPIAENAKHRILTKRGKGTLKGAKELANSLKKIELESQVKIRAITFPVQPK